jgi:hypothetical protein
MNELNPSPEAMSNIAVALLGMDMPDEAISYINAIIGNKSFKVDFRPMKKIVEEIIRLKKQLQIHPEDESLRQSIAAEYQRIGNDKAADKYLKQQ